MPDVVAMPENNNHQSRMNYHSSSIVAMPDVILECVLPYVDDPRDRGAISHQEAGDHRHVLHGEPQCLARSGDREH
ncbi:hypothetical protein Tsubulata_016317 [Turnera subulata]|nr:hypothetical protein Tsubulata_016317 [Turnera subulata]